MTNAKSLRHHTVPEGPCDDCCFCYDTIECRAPTADPSQNPHPTYSFCDTKKPPDCPLRDGPIVVSIDASEAETVCTCPRCGDEHDGAGLCRHCRDEEQERVDEMQEKGT